MRKSVTRLLCVARATLLDLAQNLRVAHTNTAKNKQEVLSWTEQQIMGDDFGAGGRRFFVSNRLKMIKGGGRGEPWKKKHSSVMWHSFLGGSNMLCHSAHEGIRLNEWWQNLIKLVEICEEGLTLPFHFYSFSFS